LKIYTGFFFSGSTSCGDGASESGVDEADGDGMLVVAKSEAHLSFDKMYAVLDK
jgi:hypothetical protein